MKSQSRIKVTLADVSPLIERSKIMGSQKDMMWRGKTPKNKLDLMMKEQ